MERTSKERAVTRNSLKEENEKMDVCDASSSLSDNKTMDSHSAKTNDAVILVSDDEDFAGFGVYNGKGMLVLCAKNIISSIYSGV